MKKSEKTMGGESRFLLGQKPIRTALSAWVVCLFALALLCRCASAAEVTFPSAGTDLGSLDDWGGAYPTADDTVIIDVAAQSTNTLGLSENLTVAGILFTNMTTNMVVNNSVSGKVLSLGAGGIRVASADTSRTFTLRVALELRENQVWDLGGINALGFSYDCTSWGGNASLTIQNVNTVTHYVPPDYAGAITYAASAHKVYYRKNGRWAAQFPTFNNGEGWDRLQSDLPLRGERQQVVHAGNPGTLVWRSWPSRQDSELCRRRFADHTPFVK